MKKTIRDSIHAAYSLHEMDIIALEINGRELIIRTQTRTIKSTATGRPVEGYVEFQGVDWGYCYVYLFDSSGNVGPFGGEKKYLIHFLDERKGVSFTVQSEVYGENRTKYFGHLLTGGRRLECIIDIYHEGDMLFVHE